MAKPLSRRVRASNSLTGNRARSSNPNSDPEAHLSHIEQTEESLSLGFSTKSGATLQLERRTTHAVLERDSTVVNSPEALEDVVAGPRQMQRSWRIWLPAAVTSLVEAILRRLQNLF